MDTKTENIIQKIKDAISAIAAHRGVDLPSDLSVQLERPKNKDHGDWATNAAMKLTKIFGMKPIDLANEIAGSIDRGADIEKIEVAPPGFMNFYLAGSWVGDTIREILSKGADYGRSDAGGGRRVQVEFVSANPTGPIHLGHGRGAAVGDVMSSLLEFSGWNVDREYYINDAGLQIEHLGLSTRSRYFAAHGREDDAPFPEDGYPGDYIDGIASKITEEYGADLLDKPLDETIAIFKKRTVEEVLKMIRRDLSDFGVEFDVWFSEASLYEGDAVPRTVQKLKDNGYAYDKDGAVWFSSTRFGDDKDRVLIRNNGVPTYFTSDAAYLQNKLERGYERIIYVWGADHHGYVPRMRSVNKALGMTDDAMEFLLIQFVSLLRNGEPVAMSKRAGTFVTLRDVMDEVGKDAARFSFMSRKCDSHLDFDLELAKRTSADNPVYYVQYAHARICSILREADARGISIPDADGADLSVLVSDSETALAKQLAKFPEEIKKAVQNFEPHKLTFYSTDLAEAFHAFYNSHKILGEAGDVMGARLLLAKATKTTLANALRLLGISAPERM